LESNQQSIIILRLFRDKAFKNDHYNL